MAEGKWTVRRESGWQGAQWAWVAIDPSGETAVVERSWADAYYWARTWAQDELAEQYAAEAGRGWPSGE